MTTLGEAESFKGSPVHGGTRVSDVSVDETGCDADDGPDGDRCLEDLPSVDDATAERLRAADVSARDLLERRVSYQDLLAADVDAETAATLRREHSLLYSSTLGADLPERSDAMEHLRGNERAWIAASDGDWENAEYDPILDEREAVDVWADRERPTPVTAIAGVSEDDARSLATAGVTSVKQLRWVDASVVAAATDLDVRAVRTWRFAARQDF